MISCDCSGDFDNWVEQYGEDFLTLDTIRSRKCASCGEKIEVGEEALHFLSYRQPRSDYEERRFGESVSMANLYLCESCGEIWLNLNAIGLCVTFGDMRDAQKEYWELTGFDPEKYATETPYKGIL